MKTYTLFFTYSFEARKKTHVEFLRIKSGIRFWNNLLEIQGTEPLYTQRAEIEPKLKEDIEHL